MKNHREKSERKNRSMKAPIFLCLPGLVNGIPTCLEILALKVEIPKNRFQENPPLFIDNVPFFSFTKHRE